MGQACSRDDEVDNNKGNVPVAVPQNNPNDGRMKPAAVVKDPPKEETPKPDNVTNLAHSKIEDVHVDSKNLEPYSKMNLISPAVQKRLDSLKPARPDDFPDLKAKFSVASVALQIVRDRKTGSTYQGQMHRGVPHGWGRYVQADGSVLEGFFEEGNPSGYIRRFAVPNASGYEGRFSNGQYNGKGTFYDDKGNATECATWVNGQAEGLQTITSSAGVRLFNGAMTNGKKQGKCYWLNEQGKFSLEGDFKDDLLEGRGLKRCENGQVYEGEFKKGLEEGRGVLTMIDGRKFEGPFSNGKANGKGHLVTDSGKRVEQTWKDGRRA